MFEHIEGGFAIVVIKGVHFHRQIYSYKSELYVEHAKGYAKLKSEGRSSVDGVRWVEVDGPEWHKSPTGNLVI